MDFPFSFLASNKKNLISCHGSSNCVLDKTDRNQILSQNGDQDEDLELPLFSLPSITKATENFSINNKLGEGGFGPVYRVSFRYSSFRMIWKK